MATNNAANYNPTNHAVLVGAANGNITSLAVGANNSILVGSTGADPSFTTTAQIQLTSIGVGTTPPSTGISLASANGILFNTASGTTGTGTSNTLSIYEEGTFTPTAIGASTAGVATYTLQNGYYQRIGNRCFFMHWVAWSAHTGTGLLRSASLPFTVSNTTNNSPAAAVTPAGNRGVTAFGAGFTQCNVNPFTNTTYCTLSGWNPQSGSAATLLNVIASGDFNSVGHFQI